MNKEGGKKTILLADDDPFIIELYSSKLVKEGFDVLAVSNGEDALLKLDSLDPDLMILDLNMPRMHGIEVLRYIKYSYKRPDLPVIVLSNAVTDDPDLSKW